MDSLRGRTVVQAWAEVPGGRYRSLTAHIEGCATPADGDPRFVASTIS
jgi:hypothetical protein